jgi:hypothetical protein
MPELAQWVASLPLSAAMRRITWLVPWLQIAHIVAIGVILSTVALIGMRSWGAPRAPLSGRHRYAPWLLAALVIVTASGVALMLSSPRSFRDTIFLAKMIMMALALPVTLVLPLVAGRPGVEKFGSKRTTVGVLAGCALVLWVGVTLAGRGRWMAGLLGI